MNENLSSGNKPGEFLSALYERWGQGGAGMAITGNVMVDYRHLGAPGQLVVEDERDLQGLAALAKRAQRHGQKLLMQINHPGRQSPAALNAQPIAPSPIPLQIKGRERAYLTPREMTPGEIQDCIDRFARTAAIAKRAGFSGVQIHAAHGYLISQFLSPRTNQRQDEWGGSFEKRLRFLTSVYGAMRESVGADFTIGIKLNAADFQRGGFTQTASAEVAACLAGFGVDFIEVSGGTYEATAMFGSSGGSTSEHEAYFQDFAKLLREAAEVPLLLTGGFRSKAGILAALQDGYIDLAGMARPFAADPDIAQKLLDGSIERSKVKAMQSGRLGGVLETGWYELQMQRIAKGEAPSVQIDPRETLRALAQNDRQLRSSMHRPGRTAKRPDEAKIAKALFAKDELGWVPPWRTIGEMLQDVFERYPEKEALIDSETRLSYAELGERVRQLAAALKARSLVPGDCVAVWSANGWRMHTTILACWWNGLTVVPLSQHLKCLEVVPLLQRVQPKAVFAGNRDDNTGLLDELFAHLNSRGLWQTIDEQSKALWFDFRKEVPSPADSWWALQGGPLSDTPSSETEHPCHIMFTSGTTGTPKGVLMKHDQVLRNFLNKSLTELVQADDRLLVISPLSHVFGLYSQSLYALMLGMCQVYAVNMQPNEVARLIVRERVTIAMGPPSLFRLLLRFSSKELAVFSSVRHALLGADHIPAELLRELYAQGVATILSAYGLTECTILCSTDANDGIETITGCVGRPKPGLEINAVSPQREPLGPNEVGEIAVRGYAVMQAYFKDSDATRAVLDDDGWLYTGDLGRIAEDGRLQIMGRSKDMFISHGFNIYAIEVERLLLQSELLAQVAIVSRPSSLAGEEGVAFYVPLDPPSFELKALRRWALANIASYKVPVKFIALDELPLNSNGKVDKLTLSAELATE